MSKIKLIVEIDEEYFHMIQKEGGINYLECAILHGTPLKDEPSPQNLKNVEKDI